MTYELAKKSKYQLPSILHATIKHYLLPVVRKQYKSINATMLPDEYWYHIAYIHLVSLMEQNPTYQKAIDSICLLFKEKCI